MPITHSPLRYPGGKTALAPFLRAVIKTNGLKDLAYVEPYCGGAGAALELLFNEVASELYLNDIDPAIYSFWKAVTEKPDQLCAAIEAVPLTIDEWHKQHAYYSNNRRRVGFKLGFAALYLNRTNRSGILGARPIGGLDQMGPWKMDARFNKTALHQKVQRISRYRSRIHLSRLDALDFLHADIRRLSGDALVYLDPPYFLKGQSLYENHYTANDHAAIAAYVRMKLKKPWVVSYDQHPAIEALYDGLERVDYGIRYTAQKRYFGRELVVISPNLSLPDTPDPLSVDRTNTQRRIRESSVERNATVVRAA